MWLATYILATTMYIHSYISENSAIMIVKMVIPTIMRTIMIYVGGFVLIYSVYQFTNTCDD